MLFSDFIINFVPNFLHHSGASTVHFEQINAAWLNKFHCKRFLIELEMPEHCQMYQVNTLEI